MPLVDGSSRRFEVTDSVVAVALTKGDRPVRCVAVALDPERPTLVQ